MFYLSFYVLLIKILTFNKSCIFLEVNHIQITDIVKDSVAYPFRDLPNFVLLMVLVISCIFIIPIPLLVGYIYRIITATIYGHDSLPNFQELAEMYVDGLKIILALIVYGLVSFAISTILVLIGSAVGGVIAAFFIILNQIVMFLISIFSLFAVANMALYNDWAAVFDVKSIWELCTSIGLLRILAWYCLLIVISFFALVTSVLSILFLIAPVIIFIWLTVFEYRSLGLLVSCAEEHMEFIRETPTVNLNEALENDNEESNMENNGKFEEVEKENKELNEFKQLLESKRGNIAGSDVNDMESTDDSDEIKDE